MSAPVSFIGWRWSKDCRLKSIAHARSVFDIVLFVYERFRVDGWRRYVNDDRLRVDRYKNMRLLAFAFTLVFVWTGPKSDLPKGNWASSYAEPPLRFTGPGNQPGFIGVLNIFKLQGLWKGYSVKTQSLAEKSSTSGRGNRNGRNVWSGIGSNPRWSSR